MEGVSLEAGLCTSRKGREETDLSFKINKKIQLSVPTKQLFPGKFYCTFLGLVWLSKHSVRIWLANFALFCMCTFPPDSPFPVDFSLVTTVKAVKGSQVFLLSLYDTQVSNSLLKPHCCADMQVMLLFWHINCFSFWSVVLHSSGHTAAGFRDCPLSCFPVWGPWGSTNSRTLSHL